MVKLLQKNVDEAVEKLKSRGIEVLGVVCHVSNAQQRKNLIDKTIQVRGKAHLLHIVFAMKSDKPTGGPSLFWQSLLVYHH